VLSIAVTNQKGGVGKTTTCINLAAELGRLGYSVLAVDMDPQGNCSSGLGIEADAVNVSLYDVLLGGASIQEALVATPWEGVSLLPATIDLAGAEVELASIISRETCLRRHMAKLDHYDVAIIDCPPSLGLLTINALVAAQKLIVPIQCEYYALEGVGQLARTIGLVRDCLNPDLSIDGVLLTMFDSRTRLAHDVVEEVRRQFGEIVFSTVIPRNVKLSEAPSYAKPITYYEPASTGAQSYTLFSREVATRWLHLKTKR
jgi:chromosome partitioning protein